MTEAPKTIWAARGLYWPDSSMTYPAPVEYTRSDIAQAESDTLRAEVARLREALEAIIWEYDPSDPGGISEIMFDIAFDAKTHGE